MRWAPPAQNNPTTVNIPTGAWTNASTPFADNEDYILVLPAGVRTGSLIVHGGRHGRIIGGDMGSTTLLAYDLTGSLFVEGIKWTMTDTGDCIGIRAKDGANPDWYFQNLNFTGIQGTYEGVHSDMIQAQGRVGGTIHMHAITCDTNYQGLFALLDDFTQRIAGLKASCCNFRSNAQPGGNGHPVFLFMQDVEAPSIPYPVELSSVWCVPHSGQAFDITCLPQGTSDGSKMNWSAATKISGYVFNGSPAVDFCPASTVGVGYVAKGYAP